MLLDLHVLLLSVLCALIQPGNANPEAKRLYDNLLRRGDYNRLIRPVSNYSEKLLVKFELKLIQITNVDEKAQVLTTNAWLRQEWSDYKLIWNPDEYGGVTMLYVPSEEIWIPDIVLYNSADGNFAVILKTKATVFYNGTVRWEPPVIYNSLCQVDVEFFPFDEQMCYLKLGSWTYDGDAIDVLHLKQNSLKSYIQCETDTIDAIEDGIDLTDFQPSTEWEILAVQAKKFCKKYTCCKEYYLDIKFNITLRRKPLFYAVNLLTPCVAICLVTVAVFYTPSDSGEKMTMCITILNSLNMLFLLVTEITPPTSFVTPLIGKYLLFTMILVSMSIVLTVFVLNVHFRSPARHTMSPWVKQIFIQILPRLLLMERPNSSGEKPKMFVRTSDGVEVRDSHDYAEQRDIMQIDTIVATDTSSRKKVDRSSHSWKGVERLTWDIKTASDGAIFIAQHLKEVDEYKGIKQDWKYVASVLDRLFLMVFTTACLVGTCGIILQAPSLYAYREALK